MKLHRDVDVSGSSEAFKDLRSTLERLPDTAIWKLDKTSAAKLAEVGGEQRATVFLYVGVEAPSARVFLFWDEAHASVGNIVPVEAGSLSCAQYNRIAELFVEDILGPLATENGCIVAQGPTELTLHDVLSERAREALKTFSGCANKSTGSAHPHDARRWDRFLILSHADRAAISTDHLEEWLREDGWGEDEAAELAIEYDHGRRLLKAYDQGLE